MSNKVQLQENNELLQQIFTALGTNPSATAIWDAIRNVFNNSSDTAVVTTYPTKPGIYKTAGTNIFSNLPFAASHYGVLLIVGANDYVMHLYIDNNGVLFHGKNSVNSDGAVVEPTLEKWMCNTKLYSGVQYGTTLPTAGVPGRLFFKKVT